MKSKLMLLVLCAVGFLGSSVANAQPGGPGNGVEFSHVQKIWTWDAATQQWVEEDKYVEGDILEMKTLIKSPYMLTPLERHFRVTWLGSVNEVQDVILSSKWVEADFLAEFDGYYYYHIATERTVVGTDYTWHTCELSNIYLNHFSLHAFQAF